MKRSAELSQLSRDHHHALYAALQLRRADDASAAAAVEAFGEFWSTHGERHFEVEERILLPCFAREGGDPRHELVTTVLADHVEIRARAALLHPESELPKLHELGALITAHVRLEEEELFPMIERTMRPQALSELARAIEEAER